MLGEPEWYSVAVKAVSHIRKPKNKMDCVHDPLRHKVAVDKVKLDAAKPLSGEELHRRRIEEIGLVGNASV